MLALSIEYYLGHSLNRKKKIFFVAFQILGMGISKSIGHEEKLLTGLIVVSLLSNDIPKLIVLLLLTTTTTTTITTWKQ